MFKKQLAEIQARRAAGEKGFTLVELLVVVVIIGVLAAIAVPIFLNQRSNAQSSADKSTLSTIAKTLATAESTGGKGYINSTTLEVSDGTGARVTVPLGNATIESPTLETPIVWNGTTNEYTSGGASVTGWCVELTTDDVTQHMASGDTEPQDGGCA